jgi:hypothetical protein
MISPLIANTTIDRDDNNSGFYAMPEGACDPSYSLNGPEDLQHSIGFFLRITPAQVTLLKGAPVDFTVHIKALQDFDVAHPLVVSLLPVLGRGSAAFARPDTAVVCGQPAVKVDGERVIITMKKTDEAARVVVHTEYPPDWWAGFSTVRVHVGETVPASVEATVIVADRVPASWQRFV